MKRLIGVALIALFASSAALASRGYVNVMHEGERHRMPTFEFDGMTVCGLKSYIAGNLGLDPRKFDLTKGGTSLKGGAQLNDAAIYGASTVYLRPTNRSYQC